MLGRRHRWTRLIALLLAFGLVAAACGGDDDDATDENGGAGDTTTTSSVEPETDDVTPGGELIVGLEAETNTYFPPMSSATNAGVNVATSIYDSIASRGADGNVYPYLASAIEPNEDLTEWTVTLREGIEMHDGTVLNAELMKTIFDDYLNAEGALTDGDLTTDGVLEVRVDDEYVYTYILERTLASFPNRLVGRVGWPFSVDSCEANGGFENNCGDVFVGAGAFQVVSWVRDGEMILERNPNYWRTDANGNALPYLDRLVFRPIPDESARLNSVSAGTIGVGHTLRQSAVRDARDDASVVSFEAIGNNGGGAIFNVFRPPVDDQRVRLALSHAVNQDDMIEVLGGTGITPPQTQFFSPDSPWFSSAVEDAWPSYDPDLAQELLQEYIDDPDRSDGQAPGSAVAIEFNCPPDPSLRDLAQTYQSFWTQAGFEVTLNAVEQAQHIANAVGADSDPQWSGEYMINCWRAGADADPYTTLSGEFGDPATSPSNFTNYSSETINANLDILRTSTDFDERYAAVEEIMFELAEQVPQIWTGGTATAFFALPEVRNIGGWTIPDAEGNPTIPGQGVLGATLRWNEVWIEQ
ncbi:MAG: ABC transporter substrate-binding protein [Acidimicrobiales bacterium]